MKNKNSKSRVYSQIPELQKGSFDAAFAKKLHQSKVPEGLAETIVQQYNRNRAWQLCRAFVQHRLTMGAAAAVLTLMATGTLLFAPQTLTANTPLPEFVSQSPQLLKGQSKGSQVEGADIIPSSQLTKSQGKAGELPVKRTSNHRPTLLKGRSEVTVHAINNYEDLQQWLVHHKLPTIGPAAKGLSQLQITNARLNRYQNQNIANIRFKDQNNREYYLFLAHKSLAHKSLHKPGSLQLQTSQSISGLMWIEGETFHILSHSDKHKNLKKFAVQIRNAVQK